MEAKISETESIFPFISGNIPIHIAIKAAIDIVQIKKLFIPDFSSLLYTFIVYSPICSSEETLLPDLALLL